MLRQVFIIKGDNIIYQNIFGNALNRDEVENFRFRIKQDAKKEYGQTVGFFDYYKYRIAYRIELELDLIFIFIAGLMDDFFRVIHPIMNNFRDEFFNLFGRNIEEKKFDSAKSKTLDSIFDPYISKIIPKISIVGLSGVGKTTIANLIKMDEIPSLHIPTISGVTSIIKIGKLKFSFLDFAGQEEYRYLWKGFIKGSNAVLVVTDSTPINIEQSRYFIELRNKEAPYARIAVIGNKQDLRNAMQVKSIERYLGLKTYPMIANRPENRDKMVGIIADILDLRLDESPITEKGIEKEVSEAMEEDKKVAETEVSIEKMEEAFSTVSLDSKLCNEIIDDIKGVHIENILRNHLNMINTTIKLINNNEELTLEEFYDNYLSYTRNSFVCKNIALKQFLETQFLLLQKSIEEDEFIASKLKVDRDIILNALLCAYLSIANPTRYPIFETIIKEFKFDNYELEAVKEIHAYYLRIVNKISKG